MNEFNLNNGFENYIVVKIFYAPTNEKNVWKKYIYIYIYTHAHTHYQICYINSSCYTIPKLTKKKKKHLQKTVTSLKFNMNAKIPTKNLSNKVQIL